MVPTYQEAENVERFLRAVRATVPAVDLAVVDDDSPDGTGQIADRVAAVLGRVVVIHRPGKEGLGAAYRQGFRWAIDAGYDSKDVPNNTKQVAAQLKRMAVAGVVVRAGSVQDNGREVPTWALADGSFDAHAPVPEPEPE